MSNIRKIAVIGATGMLGKPVTEQLAAAGFEVTALVRNLEKASKGLPSSVKRVPADLRDLQSLKIALAGQDALYLNLSVQQTEKQSAFHTEGAAQRPGRRSGKPPPARFLPVFHRDSLPDGLVGVCP
jgi:uncharacterized protein YbjT (DUF2867 family)